MLNEVKTKTVKGAMITAKNEGFFLSGFSFTNIHESQDSRGRGRAFL